MIKNAKKQHKEKVKEYKRVLALYEQGDNEE